MIRTLVDGTLAALLAPVCAVCQAVLDGPLDGAVCPACYYAEDGVEIHQAPGLFG